MAFGFGFNKAKIMASAEKFVQQGKLQNAIGEYEKIIKQDPKDLTVLNTIGDLCARVGHNEQAADYFKKAGDLYAQDGFTVKAIAVYKKLTRLNPGSIDSMSKLGELYSQQGLLSDARAQYMHVADHYLKAGDNNQAARVLQRILDLDPENTTTKSKLADLYLRLGKKDEARNIYFTTAESLYSRGAFAAAEEALDRVIQMDPENPAALLLRGMIASDSGDSASAVLYLEQVADLDSRPEALRALLRAKLQSNSEEGLEGLASKLVTVHNDHAGVKEVASWYVSHDQVINALRIYEVHADRLMAADRAAFQEALHPLIARIKDNPEALTTMLRMLERAEDSSHLAEIMELQAHACAQKGQFQEARDLYRRLAEMEPENVLHQQNYKQMQAKLGEDPASRTLSPEEATQAFMVEALEEAAPAVQQSYDPSVEKAIEAALTDAELFVSYNVPAKAIPPLEAVLPLAPRDVTVNQRLATLYARAGRYAEAARACHVLSEIYRERGHDKEAEQYLEASESYSLRAPKPAAAAAAAAAPTAQAPVAAVVEPAVPVEIDVPAEQGVPSVQEFTFDVPDHLTVDEPPASADARQVNVEPAQEAQPVSEIPVGHPETEPQEIDVTSEWEGMLTVEAAPSADTTVPSAAAAASQEPVGETEPAPLPPATPAEKIQEIQFYLDQEMWDLAKKAILDLTEIAPDAPEITDLISTVNAGLARAAAAQPAPPPPIPATLVEPPPAPATNPQEESAPARAAIPEPLEPPPELHEVVEFPEFVVAPAHVSAEPAAIEEPKPAFLEEASPEAAALEVPSPGKAEENILEVPAQPVAKPAAPAASSETKPAKKDQDEEKTTEDILSDFVGDLEKTELADFAPLPKTESAPAAAHVSPAATPAPAPAIAAQGASNGAAHDSEAASLLNDILSDLQEETAEPAQAEEDPETHYNLGIAFKEMGLLDEAIGELQKVCHAVDRGTAFSQPIQAYTWLAQCLVDKGAPEAAVRWYQRALQLPGLDDSSRCAIYYDLAAAFEAAGDHKSALANFMEVYGSNIDFRDVASRIKALKS
jgi:pilus assembly protein FimV